MSDADDTLAALYTKKRELELDHVQLAGRILQISEDIALLEHGPRRRPGRPRRISIMEIPDRDHQGGIAEESAA
ncbi:MAG TPA: hypothetical protein VJO13_06245 [Ktedonobacterales bacterium]|nr:hypothetical protein [Ktedonobacterales bacterium]